MKIEILGSGSPKCRGLTDLVERVVKEAGVTADIIKVEDIGEIVKRGVLSTPVLVIDGEIKLVGRTASAGEIKKWIGNER
jgi:small redox-active disulfide protein 2